MKRLFLFFPLLVLIGFSFWLYFSFSKSSLSPLSQEKTELKIDNFKKNMKEISFNDKDYLFLSQKIDSPERLQLWPNFTEKTTSTDLFDNYHCRFLTNGGFYDQQDRPLGWFFSQEKIWKKEVKSALLNGFFFQNQEGKVMIEDTFPSSPSIWGLQTGPILIFQGKPLSFKITNDEQARRMVAALSLKDELFFLVVTGSESLVSGPLLADLPKIIEKIGNNLGQNFKTAVNLDGGTASAFFNQEKTIKEYSWIGSFFCLPLDGK